MGDSGVVQPVWLAEPEEHDYPAAADFLGLMLPADQVTGIVARLRDAETVSRKAKDIIRASRLPLLPRDNVHVKHNIRKARNAEPWSPVLLVAGEPLTVADGYHRAVAAYYVSEDTEVRCRLVSREEPAGA